MANATLVKTKDKIGKLIYDLEDYVSTLNPDTVLIGDGDIEKISSILGQSQNSNLIYVGKTGVGKSASINGIAKRKIDTIDGTLKEGEKRLPLHMIDRRFLVLDVNTLFGSNDPAKIETDIKKIFSELDKPGDHVLIIEDANQWLKGIEDNQCQGLISTFVKGLIEGKFQSILMVRDDLAKTNLNAVMNCHSEMAELFTILEKKPALKPETLDIMNLSKAALEKHHDGLHITDEANEEIVNLTYQYPTLRAYIREQPARSLRMRDQIASTFVTRMQSRPKDLDDLESKLAKINEGLEKTPDDAALLTEKSGLEVKIGLINETWKTRAQELGAAYRTKRSYEKEIMECESRIDGRLQKIKDKFEADNSRAPTEADIINLKTEDIKDDEKILREARRLLEEADKIAKALKGEHNEKLTMNVSDVRGVFSEISGISAKDLNADEAEKALRIEGQLKEVVIGQDEVLEVIAGAFKRAKAGLKDPNKPIGSFVFAGSSGIGKSFVAEKLAEIGFDDEDAITAIDMSEFAEKHTVSRLIGAPPGYAGTGEGGLLTNAVRERSHQVILLDEIEKAHPDIFKILLQILDKGRLSDEKGTVDFRNVILICTTNLAQKMSFEKDRTTLDSVDEVKNEMLSIFSQELNNRFDGFLLFKAHEPENIIRIVNRDLGTLNKRMADKNISITLPHDDVVALVADKYIPREGARQVQKFIENNMTDKTADIVLKNSGSAGGSITAKYDSDRQKFDLDFVPIGVNRDPVPVEIPSAHLPLAGGGGTGFGAAAHMAWQRAAFAPTYAPMMS